MSEQDHRPYHAKDSAPGKEAADVVAEVLKHAAERDRAGKIQSKPKGPPKWMLPLTVNMGVLALYFLIAQPDFLIVSPINDPRATQQQVQQTRMGIYFDVIQRIPAFVQANGRLPGTLAELGTSVADQGVDYTIQGDSTYILIMMIGGETVTFNSARDDPAAWVGAINLPG